MSHPSNQMLMDILRVQAWERAKGELQSVLVTYHSHDPRYPQILELIKNFLYTVENKGLQE